MMTTIHIKIDERLKKDFDDKASKLGRPRDMIRNLMQAFVDGRISVQPTAEQSQYFQIKPQSTEEQLELYSSNKQGDVK